MEVENYSILWPKDVLICVLLLLLFMIFYTLWEALYSMWWKPRRIRRMLESQGVRCLPYHFFYGNTSEVNVLTKEARKSPMSDITHDIAPRILPHYFVWSKTYGKPFAYNHGSQTRLILAKPEHAKEVLSTKFSHYRKPVRRPDTNDLIGEGLVALEGEKWAHRRRIMNPAFFHEKLKAMLPTMNACTSAVIEKWMGPIEQGHHIDVHKEFSNLTADIIARTAFGSSYADGERVFELQHEQQIIIDKLFLTPYFPGSRFIPTALNRYRWKINREIERILTKLIKGRLESTTMRSGHDSGADLYGNDLLGLMMAANQGELKANKKNLSMSVSEIIGECKTFFFAGHETTSTLLTWASLLLATNPEWQDRAREEVFAVCGRTEVPTAEAMGHLKIMGMVLNETLRLYPPVVSMVRRTVCEMKVGDDDDDDEKKSVVKIPAGTEVMLPILVWHHEAEYWGGDSAHEFRPDRWCLESEEEGGAAGTRESVAGKRGGSAFLPFSMGPRTCIGRTFAMLEAKTVMANILRCFSFGISPAYRHAPVTVLTLQPQFGMPILFHPL